MAADLSERKAGPDEMVLFFRRGDKTVEQREPFRGFIAGAAQVFGECPIEFDAIPLDGPGAINTLALFDTWKKCRETSRWLSKSTGYSPSAPGAPYLWLNDPVHQHLIMSGRTMFKGMGFGDLKRMQIDIECVTGEGYEFCNAERESDRIAAIALGDGRGHVDVLSADEQDERSLLNRFAEIVRQSDPDVIEGHNIFNFDLPYILQRARVRGVKLALGRDGSVPKTRPGRFNAAERTIAYARCDIFGRHVVDTLFLVHAYDVATRALEGFGLKDAARHFGIVASDREYVDGNRITEVFKRDPDRIMRYVRDDAIETGRLAELLSASSFVQAGMLPYSYQNVCVRGNAAKIDALMVREYLRRRHALPMPDRPREFAGGYADVFVEGVIRNVHHCDIRSLYPSLMLARGLAPRSDILGVFIAILKVLKDMRIRAKEKAVAVPEKARKARYEAFQAAFKALINSFYGYLGFSQGRFSDFETAGRVAEEGRALLKRMIGFMNRHGAVPVEIDTDGIYFRPPAAGSCRGGLAGFRQALADSLPAGIEVEFDGEYKSMYSYKMKNYALLTKEGEIIIKGGALKSRGLEPFQRSFMKDLLRLKLEGRDGEIPALKDRYGKAMIHGEWNIDRFAKTETLQDSPAAYAAKSQRGDTPRRAAYELALKSGRDYRAGDQVSYYVTGSKKSVPVHEYARHVSEWDPSARDENMPYYLAKLDALYRKFAGPG